MALRDRIPAFGTFLDNTRAAKPASGTADATKLPDDVIQIRNGLVAAAQDNDRIDGVLAGKLGFFVGTADQIAAKISADGGRRAGVLYIEQAAPVSTTPTLTNYAQAVNERLNAGNITDVVAFGGEASGSSSIASRIISGSGGVIVTRTGSGVYHTFGPRARFPMAGGKTLKWGATVRRNTNWGTTKILTRIRFIASDGVTVISTVTGVSAAISSVEFDEARSFTGLVSPSGAAFAEIDNVSDATTVATSSAITARAYVLEEVSA